MTLYKRVVVAKYRGFENYDYVPATEVDLAELGYTKKVEPCFLCDGRQVVYVFKRTNGRLIQTIPCPECLTKEEEE